METNRKWDVNRIIRFWKINLRYGERADRDEITRKLVFLDRITSRHFFLTNLYILQGLNLRLLFGKIICINIRV